MIKQRFLFLCMAVSIIATSVNAQYNCVSCSKRPFTTRLVQVDQLDNSTLFFFEYQNDGQRYMNIYEDIVVRDSVGNNYKLLNSYNMPLSDEDHSHQLLLQPEQEHRFVLEFEKVPIGQELDIVESEGNSRAMNFYEVNIATDVLSQYINYDEWVKDYPVKETGSYVSDGSVIQYISYKGITLMAHMKQINEYGKYFSIDIDVVNNSSKDVLLDPSRITATSFIAKKKKDVKLKVLSADEYDKKVQRSQNWTLALTVIAGVAVTAAAVALEANTNNDHHNHHGPPPHRNDGWRPPHYSHHPYYRTDHYRSRYGGHELGGLAAATAMVGTAVAMGVGEGQNEKREVLQAGYVRPNTILRGQEYMGYFNIKYEKTDNLIVSIPLMGENFDFRFQWQDKK